MKLYTMTCQDCNKEFECTRKYAEGGLCNPVDEGCQCPACSLTLYVDKTNITCYGKKVVVLEKLMR